MRRVLVGLLAVASLSARVPAQTRPANAQTGPTNLDFEQDQGGRAPAGWVFNTPQQQGSRVEVSDEDRKTGAWALVISRDGSGAPTSPAILLQSFDATPYRGKRVRFRFATRVDAAATAQLWLRVDLPAAGGQPVSAFFDNMDDRPISAGAWTYYEIVGDVADNAARVFLGAMAFGGAGRVWLDDGSFEVVGVTKKVMPEAPRALTARGVVNLRALTTLLGYVRHFHPSDEAARANWNAIAIAGVRAVEPSVDGQTLTQQLSAIFAPIAPTVEVFRTGTGARAASSRTLEPNAAGPIGPALRWRHTGFGPAVATGVYRSERVPASDSDVLSLDLGGGVSARIPLTVQTDETGTLPRAPAASPAPSVPQPTREQYQVADRAVRLAGVVLSWNVFQHFYPYFDVVKTDWPAALSVALREAATAPDERTYADVLRRLVAALHDGHGRVVSQLDAPFTPPIAWAWIPGAAVAPQAAPAAAAQPNGPAALALPEGMLVVVAAHESTTLMPGDVVTAIDGVPIARLIHDREALISGATPQWIQTRAVQELAAGARGTTLTLDVERFDAQGRTARVTVTRGTDPQPYAEKRPDKVKEIQAGIYYVDLDRISDADFFAALPQLAVAKGIVFDVRGYPRLNDPTKVFGHLSQTPMTSAQWHLPQITRPSSPDVPNSSRDRMTFSRMGSWQISPQTPFLPARKAFITDGRAISYAESIMGIVENYRLGAIVGAPTAGTNGNVNTFQVPGGLTVIFTGMKVLKHDGSQHHGVGILPTIPMTRTRAGIAAGRDELLERAIQVVSE
jgi:C-terminal processing protease CtpA/Prc